MPIQQKSSDAVAVFRTNTGDNDDNLLKIKAQQKPNKTAID